jgi:hypothetical protein
MPTALFTEQSLQARQRVADEILNAPAGDYKVCEGCEGVAKAKTIVCPACHAYRFDTVDRARLERACNLYKTYPFPQTKGTIPRLPHFISVVDKPQEVPHIVLN